MKVAHQVRYYGTGHRKDAVARVWLSPGSGTLTINQKLGSEYLPSQTIVEEILEPFRVTNTLNQYDVWATTKGGGLHGQAGAVRHGIARALVEVNPDFRPLLRRLGLLTRDPRVKERKKFGRKRARRGFQFSKR